MRVTLPPLSRNSLARGPARAGAATLSSTKEGDDPSKCPFINNPLTRAFTAGPGGGLGDAHAFVAAVSLIGLALFAGALIRSGRLLRLARRAWVILLALGSSPVSAMHHGQQHCLQSSRGVGLTSSLLADRGPGCPGRPEMVR